MFLPYLRCIEHAIITTQAADIDVLIDSNVFAGLSHGRWVVREETCSC